MLRTRTPRATTTSPWTATSRDTTTCHPSDARLPPPPRPREHLSDTFGVKDFWPVLAKKKEQTLTLLSWQSELQTTYRDTTAASVPPRNYCLLWTSSCFQLNTASPWGWGATRFHRDRLVIQRVEPAGCGEEGWNVAASKGLYICIHLPRGKKEIIQCHQKTWRLKAATWGMFLRFELIQTFRHWSFFPHSFCLLLISCLYTFNTPVRQKSSKRTNVVIVLVFFSGQV